VIYEWNPEKAADNERKHGISFEKPQQYFWIRLRSLSMILIIRQPNGVLLQSV